MRSTLQIGPLALPFALLVLLSAAALGLFIGKRIGRKVGMDVEPQIIRVLLVAVVLARLAFVWQYRDAYFSAPLGILDIRDGGWDPQAGLIAAWVYTLILIRPCPALRKPLLAAIGTTGVFWMVGSFTLLALPQDEILLPAITLSTFDGGTASLMSFEGKPTVVNLWATWCPPCQREMPVLQHAQADHPELHFVFLNQGESYAAVQHFLASRNLELRNVLLDPEGKAGAQFGQSALPATLFFDASGRLVDQRIGELSHATLAQRLTALAAPSSKRTSQPPSIP